MRAHSIALCFASVRNPCVTNNDTDISGLAFLPVLSFRHIFNLVIVAMFKKPTRDIRCTPDNTIAIGVHRLFLYVTFVSQYMFDSI